MTGEASQRNGEQATNKHETSPPTVRLMHPGVCLGAQVGDMVRNRAVFMRTSKQWEAMSSVPPHLPLFPLSSEAGMLGTSDPCSTACW